MKKILFIDRDGTLINEPKDFQVDSFEKFEFKPGVLKYLSKISEELDFELKKIINACEYAHSAGLQVNAGHGLTIQNTKAIAAIRSIVELNIGHSIIARSLFVGLASATSEMKLLLKEARGL